MGIIIYQIIIAVFIISAAVLKGSSGLRFASLVALVWTLFHVFAPWLMLVQLFTIAISYGIGNAIVKDT